MELLNGMRKFVGNQKFQYIPNWKKETCQPMVRILHQLINEKYVQLETLFIKKKKQMDSQIYYLLRKQKDGERNTIHVHSNVK